jgi:MFS family permease
MIIQVTAKSGIGQIYAGRISLGIAGGMGSEILPTYLAEIAPESIRGACGIFRECIRNAR